MDSSPLPDPADEGLHAAGDDPWWSESFYFDVVSDDGSIGVFVRLGHVPNQPAGLYSLAIVRPGGDLILICDASPAPTVHGQQLVVTTERYHSAQECADPLREYRVEVRGRAATFSDPAQVLQGSQGEECEFAIDLSWSTSGIPYRWTAQDRYEIPCRVTGTVSVDGVTTSVSGHGQRDHSWGPRDWWSVEWVWSAFSLDDTTQVHAVTVPAFDGYAVGYLQKHGQLIDLSHGSSSLVVADSGLPRSARMVLDHQLTIEVTPLAWAPLRLVSPGGQLTHFVRAMARFETDDGRTGLGWIEWNLLQPPALGVD